MMIRLKKTSRFTLCGTVLLALLIGSRNAMSASPAATLAQEVDAEFSYVGGATTRGGGANIGSVEEQSANLKYVISPQITKRVLLRFGAEWQRFSFGVPASAPLPGVLQQVSAIIGVDTQLTDQWLLRAELQPGVYSDFEDESWRDVNAPLILSALYVVDADLQWFFGLRVNARSQYLVLPLLGVRWKFADEWTLNLLVPHPRLEYDFNERLKAYFGADIKAGTFKVGDRFGTDHGRSDLNHATLDYFEARIGPGLSWSVRLNVTVEADAGCMVYRRFNFFDQHLTIRSDPAPYGQVACHVRF